MTRASTEKYIRMRTIMVGITIAVCLTGIGVKAVHLQVVRGRWLSEKAAAQYERSLTARGKRGTIYDAKLRELAVSVDVTSIGISPAAVENKRAAASALASALQIDRRAVQRKLSDDAPFVWLKRHVAPKEVHAVKQLDLEGIAFIDERSRFYPYRTLMAQVLGFSGVDGNGLEGIEYYFDHRLRGKQVSLTVHRDALGRGFEAGTQRFTRHGGNNLILTIDRRIQFVAEKALQEAAEKFSARSGIAIVMAPETGALLAVAHFPFFNPNNFRDHDRELWRNRSITDPFEPGSTMKIFSAAAALEYGGYTPNSIFYCENGAYRIGRNVVHDTKKHGWLSLQQIVQLSSNIGAVKIGEMIGPKSLYRTLADFGFGAKTGIRCPGETAGNLRDYRHWTKIDAGTIAFGQGISVSALQLVAATAAIANDGVLMKPYIVQAVTDQNGKLLERFAPRKIRRVVSVRTARTVARMMQSVISEQGTGTSAALDGYTACGKTGTAQKIDETGRYARNKYVSSFIGFAPADNPKVVILVVLDEPQNKHYGGTVAAPAFKTIAHSTLDYLDVPPVNGTGKFIARKNGHTGI